MGAAIARFLFIVLGFTSDSGEADLEVVKVQAEAALYAGEKEAEMNKRISESLTDALLRYYWIKQWNGELPTTVLGDEMDYMINLPK